jgi:alanyl-tRNA synthetase
MTASELRRLYIRFFLERGHKEIASASLLPDNDPTVLFTTAGMHPIVPYLLGEKHPAGKRLVNVQKCVRTGDIDEVGDDTHLTFFEMLGNWSLGDYSKNESISMSYDFLTKSLHIPSDRLAVTVYEGDEQVPKDQEAASTWIRKGLKKEQIFYYGREENWWGPVGETGPCGPDTEIFYDMGVPACSPSCGPSCSCGKYVELWNNVFMQYNKKADGTFEELQQKNVDTGMGLERVLTVLNGCRHVYETELFIPVILKLEELLRQEKGEMSDRNLKVVCEHIRTVTFILGDSRKIKPSNTEQGYIVRRLIRRIIRLLKQAKVERNILNELAEIIIDQYGDVYEELQQNKLFILEQLEREYNIFYKTLDTGLKMAEKYFAEAADNKVLSGEVAFRLYDTFGFPIEFTAELANEKGILVDMEAFQEKFQKHQEKSRQGAAGRFKGGLSEQSEVTARLHTATHLLYGALRRVLGSEVTSRGSNITDKRLRFDFSFHRKLTEEELRAITEVVNEAISRDIPVSCVEMPLNEAFQEGAIGLFENKYGDMVKVYTIPDYSKEICGGPHAGRTSELKAFRIIKEEASSAGVRRIKAVIEL